MCQLSDETTAERWFGRQWQLNAVAAEAVWSELTPAPTGSCDHRSAWPNLQRLSCGPGSTTLRELLSMAGAGDDAEIRLCQQITTAVRCAECLSTHEKIRWLRDVSDPVGHCHCGGNLLPIPYHVYRHIPARKLRSVYDQPLAAWGTVPYAVFEVACGTRRTAFVLGAGTCSCRRAESPEGALS